MSFTLLRWAAWAPGLETPQQWRAWARGEQTLVDDGSSPKLNSVQPMLRRRFSRLTRMALQACFECLEGTSLDADHQVRTVFCSRHGEIHRTKALLDDIVRGEPISPMGFSLSVHNTASGLYSIASGNRAPSSAIAAGVDSLEMAVVDALGHLRRQPQQPVLVVVADEPLPGFYRAYDHEQAAPYALALLLGSDNSGRFGEQQDEVLSLVPAVEVAEEEDAITGGNEPHGLSVLRWLCNGDASCTVVGERQNWRWSRTSTHKVVTDKVDTSKLATHKIEAHD